MSNDPANQPANRDPNQEDNKPKRNSFKGTKMKRRVGRRIVLASFGTLLLGAAFSVHTWLSMPFAIAGIICTAAVLRIELENRSFAHPMPRNWSILLGACASVIWLVVFLAQQEIPTQRRIDADDNPTGLLLPANDPMPAIDRELEEMIARQQSNPFPTNGIFLLMGSNFIMLGRRDFVPVVRFHEKDMVSISIGPMGASVSGEFFDKNNNAFAVMKTNMFILDRPNYWRTSRPDRSTLIVTSHQNVEVLNIRFCRTNFFKISGCFHFPNGTEAIVTKSNVMYLGITLHDEVLAGAAGLEIHTNGAVGWGNMHAN